MAEFPNASLLLTLHLICWETNTRHSTEAESMVGGCSAEFKRKGTNSSPLSDFYIFKYIFPTIEESIEFNDLPNHDSISLASNLRTKVPLNHAQDAAPVVSMIVNCTHCTRSRGRQEACPSCCITSSPPLQLLLSQACVFCECLSKE